MTSPSFLHVNQRGFLSLKSSFQRPAPLRPRWYRHKTMSTRRSQLVDMSVLPATMRLDRKVSTKSQGWPKIDDLEWDLHCWFNGIWYRFFMGYPWNVPSGEVKIAIENGHLHSFASKDGSFQWLCETTGGYHKYQLCVIHEDPKDCCQKLDHFASCWDVFGWRFFYLDLFFSASSLQKSAFSGFPASAFGLLQCSVSPLFSAFFTSQVEITPKI